MQGTNKCLRKNRSTANFMRHNMRCIRENDFISALNMAHNRNSITHGSACHKESCFLAQHLCCFTLQLIHGWVVAIYIIASLFHRIRASAIFSPFARRIYSLKIILKYVCLFKYFLIILTVPVDFSWIFLVFYCNFLKSLIHLLTFFCGNLFIH